MSVLTSPNATNYRAYVIDRKGHIADVETIAASSDDAAWEAAAALKGELRIELWCLDREVPPAA